MRSRPVEIDVDPDRCVFHSEGFSDVIDLTEHFLKPGG
jgi:hypothetical protein